MGKQFLFLLLTTVLLQTIVVAQNPISDDEATKLSLPKTYWNTYEWLSNDAPPQKTGNIFVKKSNDWNFTIAIFLLSLFAIFKIFFPKHVYNILQMVKNSSIKSKQIKEQLKGDLLASVLLNLFFCLVLGTFFYILFQAKGISFSYNRYLMLVTCIIGVASVYFFKYLCLLFFGWVFQIKEPITHYTFTIFFFNKLIALFLLPVVVFSLCTNFKYQYIMVIALFIMGILLLYRYFFAYISIAKGLHMSKFHFFLYLCAMEVAPLLLLAKFFINNNKEIL